MNVSKYIKNGILAWTLTSNGYKYLTWNFVLHWRRAVPGQPMLVVCADKASYQFLNREGISCVMAQNILPDYGPQVVPFGSRQFSILNKMKLNLLDTFAQDAAIQHCIYLDGDIVVYKNIVEYLLQGFSEGRTFQVQCDEQKHECSKAENVFCPNFCTGIIAFSHGADVGCFKITDAVRWSDKPEDQVWVNASTMLLGVSISILPRDLFPNGARASLTMGDPVLKEKAMLLHYNYRVGDSKKSDMKRFGDWLLPY
jgi:hypothetical protein